MGNGGGYFASPNYGDDKIYLASENRNVVVHKNTADYEELGLNNVGESIIATPAIANGCLFIRASNANFMFRN